MKNFKLKPCPFCGGEASVWSIGGSEFYCIECDNEECGCVYGENMQLSFEEVIEEWNKRAESGVGVTYGIRRSNHQTIV